MRYYLIEFIPEGVEYIVIYAPHEEEVDSQCSDTITHTNVKFFEADELKEAMNTRPYSFEGATIYRLVEQKTSRKSTRRVVQGRLSLGDKK